MAVELSAELHLIKLEGDIKFEYNPLHNFRDKNKNLVDFETKSLNFDINHPVNLLAQYSYDGSVDLIINDNINPPRLINSRFTTTGQNKYKVIDRNGNSDTNIYDSNSEFELDTSLYKKVVNIPTLNFIKCDFGGQLKVGNYHFYFKYTDGDGNDTDFVAESGLVSVFIGNGPKSANTGIADQNSNKSVLFTLNNIDSSYSYVKVYYTRSSADYLESFNTLAFVVNKKYIINNNFSNIVITGFEDISLVALSEINSQYDLYTTAKAQAVCQNRLFLGNLTKSNIPYQELFDLSLRIYPTIYKELYSNNTLNLNYDGNNGYYKPDYIYNKVGYWPGEYYRFGIVYIMSDNSLSPVFNVRGAYNISEDTIYTDIAFTEKNDYQEDVRKYIVYSEENFLIEQGKLTCENVKGVVYINPEGDNSEYVYGIKFKPQSGVYEYLEKLNIKGFFFVRQKRLPTILCQGYTTGVGKGNLPGIYYKSPSTSSYKLYYESFIYDKDSENKRLLGSTLIEGDFVENSDTYSRGVFCPDFDVNAPYYNQIFTGDEFYCDVLYNSPLLKDNDIHYYIDKNNKILKYSNFNTKIVAVNDNVSLVGIDNKKWSSKAGNESEAYAYTLVVNTLNETKPGNNIIRGSFGPYLGLTYNVDLNSIINIHTPGYNKLLYREYIDNRCKDESEFYSISDRFRLDKLLENNGIICYRGDCYICQFTHRINRNFQDPESLVNDTIVDEKTWLKNTNDDGSFKDLDSSDEEPTAGKTFINRADVNAVQLGKWITFTVRSSRNLNIRTIDMSYPDEYSITGHDRTYYPHSAMNLDGSYKTPEALCYNDAFTKSVSDRLSILIPNVPYLQNIFVNRITYSDISISNNFKNGFRIFRSTNHRDYNMEHGSITKLITFGSDLICVFEHGVARIPINERTAIGDDKNVFINTAVVLPENPIILSDEFGSQWQESIIKTELYVYGVDTIGKKIWRTDGSKFEVISDVSILQFLNNNITFTEKETEIVIGVKNIKAHYNAFKRDVMFSFYDDISNADEKCWNICWNELLNKWITFYSWIPSYSENIDNMFFTFNRDVTRDIVKLHISKYGYNNYVGVIVNDSIWSNSRSTTFLNYKNDYINRSNVKKVVYTLLSDPYANYIDFEIINNTTIPILKCKNGRNNLITDKLKNNNIYVCYLIIKCELFGENNVRLTEFTSLIALTEERYINDHFDTNFWKHGLAGIIDVKDKIYPCKWYGTNHPFEFEFVVADNPQIQKIFENLKIISNKVAPESFHYEIVGEGYDFSDDKLNMFYRLESTKKYLQKNGYSILAYDDKYLDLEPILRDIDGSYYKDKSTIFKLYYGRLDYLNHIYDIYKSITAPYGKSYDRLSGTEIEFDNLLNEFKLLSHAKGVDLSKYGRIKGNMLYKEDLWDIQINPINFQLKNEDLWDTPPINANYVLVENVSEKEIPAVWNYDWGTKRKEAKLRDKYIKIKVRYYNNGGPLDLVVITALKTFYTISYA